MALSLRTLFLMLGFVLTMGGCATHNQNIPIADGRHDYVLGIGDKVGITVYNQEKLSGQFVIDSLGYVSMPLLEKIPAAGSTTAQLENAIKSALSPDYLNDPKVSIEVLNYRSVYVLGEVEQPGKYEYVPNMTLLQAVATAKGYTPRASEGGATITRHVKTGLISFDVDENSMIKPGDTIVINRRWF